MKRADMINKMVTVLDNLDGICSNKIIAEIILNELELFGMVPPYRLKKTNNKDLINAWDEQETI